jgi:enterochelin esterase-like enzyme
VTAEGVTLRLPDADLALEAVRLNQEIVRPRNGPAFELADGSPIWELFFPRPKADRMEYRLELVHRDGGRENICDPANPLRAPGPFGEKSVVEWPEYRTPAWVSEGVHDAGEDVELEIESHILGGRMRVILWSSAGAAADAELPLLVAHDGPEYAQYSGLLHLLQLKTSSGALPPMRAALLNPILRHQHYSASAAYARALAHEIVPQLVRIAPTPPGAGMRVGMGASLGALSMLHAHRTNPGLFGALFLQSGSYFRQRFDPQESGFVRFGRIARFMGNVLASRDWPNPITVGMTCGRAEENLANNRATRDALHAQEYDVSLHELADAHNWVAWRDGFDPHLVDLLARGWS